MKIAIIGFGNLGRAFAEGVLKSGVAQKNEIAICAKSDETIKMAEQNYGFSSFKDAIKAIKNSELIVFALKANVFNEIMKNHEGSSFKNKRIISLMAGLSSDEIRRNLCFDGEVIRAMPNLAIASGKGTVGYTKTDDKEIICIFESLGFAFEIAETDIEKITAFSACGLGFSAYILDCFVSAGKELGLDEKLCMQIICRNFENAIALGNLEQTISAVATKGGATEQGLQYMLDNNLPGIICGAVNKAYEKTRTVTIC